MNTIHTVLACLNLDALRRFPGERRGSAQPQPPRAQWPTRGGRWLAAAGLGALLALAGTARAGVPLEIENFNFTAGTLLTNNVGWAVHSGNNNNPITITSPSLTYSGYQGGVGV